MDLRVPFSHSIVLLHDLSTAVRGTLSLQGVQLKKPRVNNEGSVLYYEDSGIPNNSETYVTLVLVHGSIFHGAVFRPMLPYAAENNLRLVLLNMRDYPGSTLYTPAELAAIRNPCIKTQAAAARARGFEIATFLRWFIENAQIPPIVEAPSAAGERALTGGVSLLGWSFGNAHIMSFLAHATDMPADLHGYLSTYLRSYFIHEPPTIAIGGIFPNAIYMPLYDQNLTLDRKVVEFQSYILSYYTSVDLQGNTPHESTCPVDMASDFATYSRFEEILAARKALCGDKDTLGDPRQAPAVDRMTCDELGGITHPEVMARSECYLHSLDCRVYRENYRRALFRCNTDPESEVEVRTAWPALKVHLLWCDMSIGHCVLGAQIIADEAARYKGRTVVVHRLEKANHFIHWEEPEFFTKFLASKL